MDALRPDPVLLLKSCRQEQAWNQRQLEQPVGTPVWRLWGYQTPGLVLGCAQKNAISSDPAQQLLGIDAIGRQAGGGAVLAGPWMLSASVLLPNAHALVSGNLVASYRWLGELYAALLQDLGIAAHAIAPAEARVLQQAVPAELGWACFGGFSPWEVVVGRKKIVGLAQVRRRTGVMLVAGLLLDRPDWQLLVRSMAQPASHAAMLEAGTTSCTEQLGQERPLPEIASSLAHALQDAIGYSGHAQQRRCAGAMKASC
jgi:lipoate---protein ligase